MPWVLLSTCLLVFVIFQYVWLLLNLYYWLWSGISWFEFAFALLLWSMRLTIAIELVDLLYNIFGKLLFKSFASILLKTSFKCRKTHRQIFHLLVHSSNAFDGWGWTKPKAVDMNSSTRVFYLGDTEPTPGTYGFSGCTLAGECLMIRAGLSPGTLKCAAAIWRIIFIARSNSSYVSMYVSI